MNYLAHFHLAGSEKGLQVGALLGDYVKGPLKQSWPTRIEDGIKLHRLIDGFSDRHRVQQELKKYLPEESYRYRGILFDVFCDHYLSKHWHSFHTETLPSFADIIYQQLEQHEQTFPDKAKEQSFRLRHFNALCCFNEIEAVLATIDRVSDRLKEKQKVLTGAEHFVEHIDRIETLFLDFYPELMKFSDQEIRNFSR